MRIVLKRLRDNGKSTQGIMFLAEHSRPPLAPRPLQPIAFTIEDTYRTEKVKHQTRIPAGVYELKLRTEGGFHDSYKKKFKFHKGMIWLQNVPGFEHILIHIGNGPGDTSGCLLVANALDITQPDFVSASTLAYERVYVPIADALARGERCEILVQDEVQWLI